jgi:protocatechuate 4,5-dioxygenase beta chain
MLSLGLATSYAPVLFRDTAEWPKFHEWLTKGAPKPLELAQETPEVLQQQRGRIQAGLSALRQRLGALRPDLVVLLASDTGRVFTGVQVPQLCTYLGEEISGSTRVAELGEKADADVVKLRCAPQVSNFLQQELVEKGFDMNYSKTLRPLGQADYGTTPAFVEPARALLPSLEVPVVPIYVNCSVPPMSNGERCYAFGRALAEILGERPEKIALLAAGGLNHDYHGPRAGWVDAPLDQWVLNRVSRGKGAELKWLFEVDSDTLRGGSAHVRLWAVLAGAFEALRSKATVVDYFPSYTAGIGIGFAYWPVN